MRIGLLDVDGHNFPNLPLMKISNYYKSKGHEVEKFFVFDRYDRVYVSKVFNFTKDYDIAINADEIMHGGTGYGLDNRLSQKMENQYPDYELYGIKNTAYGFLTRGCPRRCGFCIVSEKEGCISKQIAELSDFWRGQKEIKLLDSNLLAASNSIALLQRLVDSKAYIDFTQGLDVRLLADDAITLLSALKIKMIHFAWDDANDKTTEMILKKIRSKLPWGFRKIRVYVLVNYNSTHEQDVYRINKLREFDYDPYVMVYNKISAPKITKRLQRWVNNKFIFMTGCTFEDFLKSYKSA